MQLETNTIKLCTSCYNCKRKNEKIYCKFGYKKPDGTFKRLWEEVDDGKTILHTPYDFNCPEYEEA